MKYGFPLAYGNSDLKPGNDDLNSEDATYIFCERAYLEGARGELWIQCFMSRLWVQKNHYVCHYCS